MKSKNLFLVFYFALPVLILVRIFQLTEMIDSSTGFYVEGFESAGTFIAAGIAVAMVIFAILGRMNDSWPEHAPPRSRTMAGISGAVAVGLIFEAADFFKAFSQALAKTEISPSKAYDPKLLKTMTQERNIQIISGGLYIILLCAALLFFAYHAWSNVRPARRMPIYAIFPVLWSAIRLGRIFMQYTGIADISENIFDIMMLCLMLLFWLLHARILTGYGYASSVKWIFGVGLSASMMAIVCTVPRLYVMVFGGGVELHEASVPKLINIAAAVYMWYFLFEFKKVQTVSSAELRAREEEESEKSDEHEQATVITAAEELDALELSVRENEDVVISETIEDIDFSDEETGAIELSVEDFPQNEAAPPDEADAVNEISQSEDTASAYNLDEIIAEAVEMKASDSIQAEAQNEPEIQEQDESLPEETKIFDEQEISEPAEVKAPDKKSISRRLEELGYNEETAREE